MKKPYEPKLLPIIIEDREIIDIYKLENDARARIAEFNSMLDRSPIKEHLLTLFTLDESIQSTRIEGTQTTFDDVIGAEVKGIKNNNIKEVVNYFIAIDMAKNYLETMPISTRLFHKIHEILLKGVRGESRDPGNYRTIQNFIGPTRKIEDATYIPPEPQKIPELISNLEKYINDELPDDMGVLSRAAIIHAQFETIHPYLDGNGRLGRILILIFLLSKEIISNTSFFVSEELERNKFKYYALLNGVRGKSPKWKEWIIFFIQAAMNQADKYIEKLKKIEELFDQVMEFAKELSINREVVKAIFNKPIFTIKQIETEANISYNTARRHVNLLLDTGMVFADDKLRNKSYNFYALLDIMR